MTSLFDINVKLSIPRYVPSCWKRETVYCTVVFEAQMLAECETTRAITSILSKYLPLVSVILYTVLKSAAVSIHLSTIYVICVEILP